jgi:4-hydroxybenzoate polyprenyltransferase
VIRRLRLVLLVVRPPVALLFGLYAAIGLAQAGHGEDRPLLLRVLLVVFGFLMFSVACNDIADVEIDRVNLTGDRRRPLVARTGGRREMLVIGMTAAVVSLGVSATLGWPVLVVTSGGVLLSANYSLRPVRFADRGALASLLLPACYVAVPFLAGCLAVAPVVHARAVVLLTGLYVTFVGRILLKDFRDVRGDALYGKRTFLVRHGRRWTCVFSACGLAVGTVVLLFGVDRPGGTLIAACVAGAAGMLVLLRALAAEPGHHRDDAVIAAIAIIGRGMLLMLLAQLAMNTAGWSGMDHDLVVGALALLTAGQAITMFRHGPVSGLRSVWSRQPRAGRTAISTWLPQR